MGHYDSDYEYEREKSLKKYKKEVEKSKTALIDLLQVLPDNTPRRLHDGLDALNDWLINQAAR